MIIGNMKKTFLNWAKFKQPDSEMVDMYFGYVRDSLLKEWNTEITRKEFDFVFQLFFKEKVNYDGLNKGLYDCHIIEKVMVRKKVHQSIKSIPQLIVEIKTLCKYYSQYG